MKYIKTNRVTILLIKVPDDAERFSFGFNDDTRLYYYLKSSHNSFDHRHIKLPSGQYQILGKSTELSEEQKEEICEQVSSFGKMYWKNYLLPMSFTDGFTVQESYLSLLEANGIIDRNNSAHPSDIMPQSLLHYEQIKQKWQEAQSKVKHYLVLEKL